MIGLRNLMGGAGVIAIALVADVQPAWTQVLTIVEIQANQTEQGTQLQFKTSTDSALQAVSITDEKTVTVRIANAQLGAEVANWQPASPIAGIKAIQVKQLSANVVQVTIIGVEKAPLVTVQSNQAGLLLLNVAQAVLDTAESESEEEEEEVTVTGARSRQTPPSVTVITAEQIKKQQARDLRDLVRYEPGVSVPYNNRGGLQGITIRGLGGNRVDLRVDDVRLPDEFSFGVTSLGRDYVEIETLNALEIFRGSSSGANGSDAIAGTVTFQTATTRSLLDQLGKNSFTNLRGLFSSKDNSKVGTIAQANRTGEVDTLFIFTRRISGDLKVGGGDSIYQDDQDKKRNNFLGKFGYRFNPYSFLELTGEVFDDKTNTLFSTENLRGSAFETTTQILNEDRITQRQRVSLSYQFDNPADQSWLQFARASVYFQNAEIEENSRRAVVSRTGITRDEADKSFLDRVAGGILQFRSDFALGSTQHRFSYGITTSSTYNERNDLRYNTTRGDRLSLAGYPRKDFPDSRTFRLGVYLQNEITLGGAKVKLIPALRYDVYNVTVANNPEYLIKQETPTGFSSTALSPSLNLVYQATPNLSIFGRYSRGFRPPTYSELNTSFRADIPIRPHKGVPNPSLKAETSNNFEMGFRYSSNQFNLDFTGFYNRYKNFMEANALAGFDFGDVSFGVPFQVFQTRNVAEAEIYGLELKGSYRFSPNPGGVYLRGALGWQQGNDLTRNRPLPTVGPLQAVVGLGYRDPNDKWGIEAITTFVAQAREQENFVSVQSQTFRNPRPVIVNLYEPSGYTLLDVIGYVNITPNLTLTLGGYNMFNTSYYQYSDVRTIDTNSPIFEAQRGRYAQPGRNFAIGISWRF